MSSYVDDTRATRCLKDTAADCSALQEDLEAVYKWAQEVNMVFNGDKFEVVRFWPGSSPKPENSYLDPNGDPIEEKVHLRDLGVQISSDLTFSLHIENTVARANRWWGGALGHSE